MRKHTGFIQPAYTYITRLIDRIDRDNLFLAAAGIAFNALICIAPLFLIVFSILGFYLDPETAIDTIDSYIESLQLFPVQEQEVKQLSHTIVNQFIDSAELAGLVGGFGLIFASTALFSASRTVLNGIFAVQNTKSILVTKLKDVGMLSIVGIVVLAIQITFFSASIMEGLVRAAGFGESVLSWMEPLSSTIISFVGVFAGFYALFYLIPDKKMSWRTVLLSSAVAAALWTVARMLFTYYITHLWRIGNIYGPYALLVVIAIWGYYSAITVLLAAEIGRMSEERTFIKRLFHPETLAGLRERAMRFSGKIVTEEEKNL